jgi:Xaa-Pro aminopeptidase
MTPTETTPPAPVISEDYAARMRCAVDDATRLGCPGSSYHSGTKRLPLLRAVKDANELAQLEAAGAAADATGEHIVGDRFVGSKETDRAADLARLLREFRHEQVDFTVVAMQEAYGRAMASLGQGRVDPAVQRAQ